MSWGNLLLAQVFMSLCISLAAIGIFFFFYFFLNLLSSFKSLLIFSRSSSNSLADLNERGRQNLSRFAGQLNVSSTGLYPLFNGLLGADWVIFEFSLRDFCMLEPTDLLLKRWSTYLFFLGVSGSDMPEMSLMSRYISLFTIVFFPLLAQICLLNKIFK